MGSSCRESIIIREPFFKTRFQWNFRPGEYHVIARANGYGYVTVPVIIEARRSTVLHLEGDGSWPDESMFNQTNAVRLPDGQIVGRRTDL